MAGVVEPKKAQGKAAAQALKDASDQRDEVVKKLKWLRVRLRRAMDGPVDDDGRLPGGVGQLAFKSSGLSLFVELGLDIQDGGDELDVGGIVVYGADRGTASGDPDKKSRKILEFRFSRLGLLQDPCGVKGTWVVGDEESDFAGLHCQIVRKVLPEASRWGRQFPVQDRS